MVQVQSNPSGEGGMHTVGFSLGIEPNLVNGIAISHAVVKYGFVYDDVLGGQLPEGSPFFIIFGFVGFGSRYDLLRIEESVEAPFPVPRKDFVIDHLVQVP